MYANTLACSRRGGGVFKKNFFLFPIRFKPIFLNLYLFNEKSIFANNWRAEPTVITMENIIF